MLKCMSSKTKGNSEIGKENGMLKNITMNGIHMQEDSSLTILDVARKHGIDIPTLCFLKKDDCNFVHRPASCL